MMSNAKFTQPTFQNDQIITGWNLSQINPNTKIGEGMTGLIFNNCNLVNCDIPPDAITGGCLHIQKSFCANLHPDLIAFGLTSEIENCAHVVDTHNIYIDGVLVDTIYDYEDTVV